MRTPDVLGFALAALRGHLLRSGLVLLAMAIGVAAVVLLTALGEGARRYVTGEFAALGTDLLTVMPGRTETTGGAPPITGETARDLTLADARALTRSHAVRRVAPINLGEAPVRARGRSRAAVIVGTTAAYFAMRRLAVAQGRTLPEGDPRAARPLVVLGATIRDELFGASNPLGQWVRIGERRFRVVGVVERRGQQLGIDLDEVAIMPVAAAQQLFDTPALFRILVQARGRAAIPAAERDILAIIRARHEGEADITVITQDSVLAAFDRIFTALNLAVAGIAGISLLVAGILVMNVMLVAVTQRRAEIGLLKALGAPRRRIVGLILAEAALLALAGAVAGVAAGIGAGAAVRAIWPVLPVTPPWWAVAAAVTLAVASALGFAVLPARRAARLDPVAALAKQ